MYKSAFMLFTIPLLLFIFSEQNILLSPQVKLESHVESNSSSMNSSNTTTDIRIESNGEVKEYHSEDGGSVSLESSDGSVKVNVNNNGSREVQSNPSSTPTVTVNEDDKAEKEASNQERNDRGKKEVKDSVASEEHKDNDNTFIEILLFIPKTIWGFLTEITS